MPINKVIYGNSTLLDLTSDTVSESNVASGKTFHRKDGTKVTGTAEMAQASYSNQTITLTNGFPVSVGGGGVDVTPLSVTENGTYTAPSGTAYTPVTVNVSGSTPSGGKVIQYNAKIGQVTNKTSMTTTNVSLVVEETGNYKVSWVAWAYANGTSSQNYSTQIYAGGSAKGSSHYASVYSGTGTFAFTENSIALTAGQTVEIRARTRSGNSYYTTAGMLVIEKI